MSTTAAVRTTNVSLRLDKKLLARIDHAAQEHGETRTEYLTSWLPENYGPVAIHSALLPLRLKPSSAGTQTVTLRLDDELIERIDKAATHHGISRTEYILSWQPMCYDSAADETDDTP